MSANQILDMIGDAKGSYIWEAQQSRTGAVKHKRTSPKRVWLLAAIITVALLLVGCTIVYVLSLQDMKLGEEVWEDYHTGETQPHSALSLQGFAGSPSYQAAKEWYEWKQRYDPNSELLTPSAEDYAETLPEAYQGYLLYTPEMRAEVDALCEKYGLNLLGKEYIDATTEDMFQTLQIGSIFRPDAPVQPSWSQGSPGYFYANGAFEVEAYIAPTGEDSPWPEENFISYRCHRKDTFDDVTLPLTDMEHYQQWSYQNADGITCLLAVHPENGALIVVDKEDYFITVTLESKSGNILDGYQSMDKATLEAFADIFNFTIQPKPVTPEALAAAEARVAAYWEDYNQRMQQAGNDLQNILGEESYAGRVKYHLENFYSAYRTGYTFYDLDSDGQGELLIGRDGYIRHIYSQKDGETVEILGWSNDSPTYLAEDGTLVSMSCRGTPHYEFFHVENGQRVIDKTIDYNPERDGENLWWLGDHHSSSPYVQPISEEEFWQIAASKKRVVLTFQPLSSFPLEEEVDCPATLQSTFGEDGRLRSYYGDANFDVVIRHTILNSQAARQGEIPDCRFCLLDLDGDGQEELLLEEEGGWWKLYTMADGKLCQLAYNDALNLCKGNIVELVHSYTGDNKTYCYFRKEGNFLVPVEYLRYDVEVNPANPWFRSTDASGQDISMKPISRAEFDAIRERFPLLDLEMKPISDYPLSGN